MSGENIEISDQVMGVGEMLGSLARSLHSGRGSE